MEIICIAIYSNCFLGSTACIPSITLQINRGQWKAVSIVIRHATSPGYRQPDRGDEVRILQTNIFLTYLVV